MTQRMWPREKDSINAFEVFLGLCVLAFLALIARFLWLIVP